MLQPTGHTAEKASPILDRFRWHPVSGTPVVHRFDIVYADSTKQWEASTRTARSTITERGAMPSPHIAAKQKWVMKLLAFRPTLMLLSDPSSPGHAILGETC